LLKTQVATSTVLWWIKSITTNNGFAYKDVEILLCKKHVTGVKVAVHKSLCQATVHDSAGSNYGGLMLARCDVFIPIDAVTTYFEEESSVVGIIIILLKKPRGARASMSRETLICLFSIG
jgi:hypothetical protein